MTSVRTVLLAGVAVSLLAMPATAGSPRPLLLAQAGAGSDAASSGDAGVVADDPVATAEKAVEDARTALRAAIASGQGVDAARQALRTALKALEDARLQAGLPPAENPTALEPILPEEAPPPAADQSTGDSGAPSDQPVVAAPPADQGPPADATTPPPTDEAVVPPADQSPPAADGTVVAPPAPPAAVAEEPPPPPPPPAATAPTFDLNKFKNRPKFGAAPAVIAAPTLPATGDVVKEGAAIAAPDGRLIVKEGGQVTVNHDDSDRFRQIGGQAQTVDSGNGMKTTTITRPDGSQVVTVRDASGNILQRYRKNRDGNVEMLIGEAAQPGVIDRVLGRTPPPVDKPPSLNLKLGPLQLSIPADQYIVESSRASPTQLQKTLVAPPVEAVERPYTLEEIRLSGRLRDKVRRIDFDTITFDTAQATVADDQIQRMQNIGQALRAVIERDPSQVFLVEGHTDAVGSDLSNLALSDRRAETVAEILAYYFGIPPENLVTQGYGEAFLKIPTVAAERQNRRVAFRNITYLLRGASAQ
jgi:outer membrane protein OmpA-like peptidoglycan-associated protein